MMEPWKRRLRFLIKYFNPQEVWQSFNLFLGYGTGSGEGGESGGLFFCITVDTIVVNMLSSLLRASPVLCTPPSHFNALLKMS
jgi:hypothetical protein